MILRAAGEPKRWLDVGGGHGHFCCVAKGLWPETRFDALDLSESIEEAVRRRWVDEGFRGLFPDKAGELAGRYDVVSMSHYLEHTREPEAEIRAAATALGPKGWLMIEVPDPEFVMGRILGRFWLPWFQPQHQHLLSVKNLTKILEAHGFEPMTWHRGAAHQPVDFWAGAFLVLSAIAPKPDVPWRPPHGAGKRWWRTIVLALAVAGGRVIDLVLKGIFERAKVSNTYRVLARKIE
jgi:SAM-dependent methyltransferase